jgi:hypothetical protein
MQQLTFEDALRIARGCADYGGGYSSNDEHYEIYQQGIKTVIAALTAASNTGLEDRQVAALYAMGDNAGINRHCPERSNDDN